jgi:hypothetical protein
VSHAEQLKMVGGVAGGPTTYELAPRDSSSLSASSSPAAAAAAGAGAGAVATTQPCNIWVSSPQDPLLDQFRRHVKVISGKTGTAAAESLTFVVNGAHKVCQVRALHAVSGNRSLQPQVTAPVMMVGVTAATDYDACAQSGKTTFAFRIIPAILADDPVLGRGPTEALMCRVVIPVSCSWCPAHGRQAESCQLPIFPVCRPQKLHVQAGACEHCLAKLHACCRPVPAAGRRLPCQPASRWLTGLRKCWGSPYQCRIDVGASGIQR